ncbi:zf-HC2 domain-containing protein [Streptomyces sp. NPDC046931]|uniref:zf-HC2 domain-containing protein n=1 Tax=Streptomyces sp. NPDC046931 TaxID=3154806 RepID=UPI0033E1F301
MSNDVTCEEMREIGAELALGVLPARERAEAVAHLDRCAGCREYIEQLTLVGDRLIGLLPGREPTFGFETRVARSLMQETSARKGLHSYIRGSGIPRTTFGGRVRLRAAGAVTALVLAVGFGGWAVGTALQDMTAAPPIASEVGKGMLWGALTSAGTPGKPGGEIFAHSGSPGWVYMTVDLADAGNPYNGEVSCLLERSDGSTVRIGSFTLRGGYGYWGGPAPVDSSSVSGIRLTSPDGTVLAKAHLKGAGRV